MAVDRAAIYDALAARLFAADQWRGTYRSIQSWDSTTKPAICVEEGQQTPISRQGFPPVWKLEAWVVVHAIHRPTPDTGSSPLQGFIRSIEAALERQENETPNPGQAFLSDAMNCWATTLNGLCAHAWISGPVEVIHGDTAGEALAGIPIEILVTS